MTNPTLSVCGPVSAVFSAVRERRATFTGALSCHACVSLTAAMTHTSTNTHTHLCTQLQQRALSCLCACQCHVTQTSAAAALPTDHRQICVTQAPTNKYVSDGRIQIVLRWQTERLVMEQDRRTCGVKCPGRSWTAGKARASASGTPV